MSVTLRRDLDDLFEYVESNDEYRALLDETTQKTHQFGFPYLNSPDFEALSTRSRKVLESIIRMTGDDDLEKTLSTWNDLMKRREEAMVGNIYDYCRTNPFTNGVFLVGAGHFSSIVKGIEGRPKAETQVVNWKLWNRP